MCPLWFTLKKRVDNLLDLQHKIQLSIYLRTSELHCNWYRFFLFLLFSLSLLKIVPVLFLRFDFSFSLDFLCVAVREKDVYSRDTQHSTVLLFFLSFLLCPVCFFFFTQLSLLLRYLDLIVSSFVVCVCVRFTWLKYEAYCHLKCHRRP